MSSRLNHQHAAYALRQDMELNRVQATQEVNRYYDHWGKVTTRFDNWTNQKYYDNAEKKLQNKKKLEEKQKSLVERRSKLRVLFDSENKRFAYEKECKRRPHSTAATADLGMLERVHSSLQQQELLKRKLELQAKLYGRWRHGVDNEKLLYESKSNNEVLAKLNWLDKQIETQQQRERDEALTAERQLLLQQEISRTEEAQKQRQLIREQEIKQIRELQESHMAELTRRQEQTEKLKEEERHLSIFLEELQKELQLIEESTALVLQRPDIADAFNLKKIKVFIRNRSETNRQQINLCINLLNRILSYAAKPQDVQKLLNKYKGQLEAELLASNQIDSMYESEAKSSLQRCEETWREQHLDRYADIKQLIEDMTQDLSALKSENIKQQEEIVEMRSTHLTALENSNKQLELLNLEAESSPRMPAVKELPPPPPAPTKQTLDSLKSATNLNMSSSNSSLELGNVDLSRVSSSFSNLNLNCWESLPAVRGGIDSPRLNKTRSMNVVTSSNVEPPKFARKRVAWT